MNKDLLKHYFDNDCTPEEREQLTQWFSDPRHREEVLRHMDDEWDRWMPSAPELDEASREAELPFSALFHQATAREKKAAEEEWFFSRARGRIGKMGRMGRLGRMAAGVTACLIFLLGGAWIGYYYHGKLAPEPKAPVYYATAQTLRGQTSRLVLSDGSEVYLNADSRISFPSELNARQVVYLEGEAFFNVPNKEKPMIIKTRDLVACTRGSRFNISAFPRDSTVTVSVEKGRTEISSNNERTFPLLNLRFPGRDSAARRDTATARATPGTMPMLALRPVVVKANESVTFDKNSNLTTIPAHLNEEELRSWKDGFIYFVHADSTALVDKLERWFDVEVSLNTEGVPLKPLNCGFRNATLTEVLQHIGNELGLDYRIDGKHVYLTRHVR